MRNIKKSKGFTLIELVVVIVILGILSAVALPKFVNFTSEAIITSSESLRGSIDTAAQLTYLKAIINNQHEEAASTIEINGETIDIVYGYPAGTTNGIVKLMAIDFDDFANGDTSGEWHSRASTIPGAWVYWHGSFDENAGSLRCYVRYRQSTAENTKPIIDFENREC